MFLRKFAGNLKRPSTAKQRNYRARNKQLEDVSN